MRENPFKIIPFGISSFGSNFDLSEKTKVKAKASELDTFDRIFYTNPLPWYFDKPFV